MPPAAKCAPDVFFIRRERVPAPLPKEFAGVPDLVIDALSPSDRRYDLHEKRLIYWEAGVPEIWFIDAEFRQVIADRRGPTGYSEEVMAVGRMASSALPGFWIETSWLWATPLPSRVQCLQEILRES